MTTRRGLTAQTPLSAAMHSWMGWWAHAQRKEVPCSSISSLFFHIVPSLRLRDVLCMITVCVCAFYRIDFGQPVPFYSLVAPFVFFFYGSLCYFASVCLASLLVIFVPLCVPHFCALPFSGDGAPQIRLRVACLPVPSVCPRALSCRARRRHMNGSCGAQVGWRASRVASPISGQWLRGAALHTQSTVSLER